MMRGCSRPGARALEGGAALEAEPEEGRTASGIGAVPRRDVRRIAARELAQLGRGLYIAGHLNDEELVLLTRQPDLHPAFDRTIGALIGERADPERPQDAIARLEARLRFLHMYPDGTAAPLDRIRRVLDVLRRVGGEGGFDTDRRT